MYFLNLEFRLNHYISTNLTECYLPDQTIKLCPLLELRRLMFLLEHLLTPEHL